MILTNKKNMEEVKNHNKYIIYARKSTVDDGRQVLSIESQINELRELAKKRNLEIVDVFFESRSAKKQGRPIFNKMLKIIEKNQAQGILAWKLDRLARNPIDAATVQMMLQEETIKHIVTFEKDYFPGDNILLMVLEFGMANQFIIDLRKNVKRGIRHKLEKGILPGLAPIGYLNRTDANHNKIIVKDPERFELVKKMWELLLRSDGIEKISAIATNELGLRTKGRKDTGKKPLSLSRVYAMFSNPFYAGIIRRKQDGESKEYKGIHEPMITLTQFEEAQYILGRKDRPRSKTHEFAYTGIMRCGECGSMITAEEKTKCQKNGNVHHYTYYHCTKRKKGVLCKQLPVKMEEIENQILAYLEKIFIPNKFRDWAIKYFDEVKDDDKKESRNILESQKLSLEKTDCALKRLTDLLLEGVFDKEEFSQKKQELSRKKWQLEEKIQQNNNNLQKWLEPIKNMIFFANQAKNWFVSGNKEE
ncbi:recombinase family protein [Candidatus Desantisbacteria bacterium]|nr:recombinase family protein [Candidatus Desantisbacteria bacterium]